jgi:6-phosphofructokinase 1
LKNIGVVTSGGDAPGMNAAIRGVVRIAYSENFQVLGFERGWEGLLTNTFRLLTPRSVGGIIQLGGTILRTSRCPQFRKREGIEKASETLALNNVAGLIVIGGNGSFKGALELSKKTDTQIVGIPATIDNDVFGTDETIGFDTAVNTEVKYAKEKIFKTMKESSAKGKKSGIIVAAEGIGDIRKLAREIEENTGAEVRLSVLGYAQRGGNPTARSRLLANLFANKAVELLLKEQGNRIVGLQKGRITSIELEKSYKTEKPLDLSLLQLAKILAT